MSSGDEITVHINQEPIREDEVKLHRNDGVHNEPLDRFTVVMLRTGLTGIIIVETMALISSIIRLTFVEPPPAQIVAIISNAITIIAVYEHTANLYSCSD
jgi:hypothetical protein